MSLTDGFERPPLQVRGGVPDQNADSATWLSDLTSGPHPVMWIKCSVACVDDVEVAVRVPALDLLAAPARTGGIEVFQRLVKTRTSADSAHW